MPSLSPSKQPLRYLASQTLFNPDQHLFVQQVFFAEISLGFEQTLDIEHFYRRALDLNFSHIGLDGFIGLAVRNEKQVNQQVVGNTYSTPSSRNRASSSSSGSLMRC